MRKELVDRLLGAASSVAGDAEPYGPETLANWPSDVPLSLVSTATLERLRVVLQTIRDETLARTAVSTWRQLIGATPERVWQEIERMVGHPFSPEERASIEKEA